MTSKSPTLSSIEETLKKVSSSVLPSIKDHVSSSEFDHRKDGLDFLEVKNSLLLSYLIDMTKLIQYQTSKSKLKQQHQQQQQEEAPAQKESDEEEIRKCIQRLNEMKVIIEKIRPMEKKMRYQIDKLLTISSSSSSFAFGGQSNDDNNDNKVDYDNDDGEGEGAEEKEDSRSSNILAKVMVEMEESDPLAFRPNLDDFGDDSGADNDSDDDHDEDDESSQKQEEEDVEGGDDDSSDNIDDDEEEDDDEEILAAKAAINTGMSSTRKKSLNANNHDSDDNDDKNKNNIYKAPRLAAVPFAEKEKQQMKEERRLKKQRERMRKSELLSTLKATYGDMPEEDDLGGGATIGKQRESARMFAEREMEKTQFEEDAFVRLTTSRKDKKLRKRIMREEVSNLHSIADIGNLTAGVSIAFGGDKNGGYDEDEDDFGDGEIIKVGGGSNRQQSSRHLNGKRRRTNDFEEGGTSRKAPRGGKRRNETKNTFQRALYGIAGGSGKKKKK